MLWYLFTFWWWHWVVTWWRNLIGCLSHLRFIKCFEITFFLQTCIFQKCKYSKMNFEAVNCSTGIFEQCISKRLLANPDRMPGWRGDIMAGATFCAHRAYSTRSPSARCNHCVCVRRVNTLSGIEDWSGGRITQCQLWPHTELR